MPEKKCYFCGGTIKKKKVRVDYRWGNELTILENVPAWVCNQCGEKYFDTEVAKKMERLAKAKEKVKKSINVSIKEFGKVKAS
ncbi:MAG: type II toxin-antitoxin system MqsA family antitoxin [Actinobacteria bacterium]|nr:type II toxin-antitoxin system MqsA family antitoxin [Actinomycetota bacterium]